MGARTPSTLRPRRGAIKCEYCGRSLSNINALKTHQNTLHASALRRKRQQVVPRKPRRPLISKPKAKFEPGKAVKVNKKVLLPNPNRLLKKPTPSTKTIQKTVKRSNSESKREKPKPEPLKSVKQTQSKPKNVENEGKAKELPDKMESDLKVDKSTPKIKDKVDDDLSIKAGTGKRRKIEFKCPKCEKQFPMSFKAQKHIQKYHCVNSAGDAVAADSPDLIQPIQIEFCTLCDVSFTGTHDCPHAPKQEPQEVAVPPSGPYGCVACRKTFDRLALFQKHVTSMHNDGLESMLFPTLDEFETWRHKMEAQTKTHYISTGFNISNKSYYQCLGNNEHKTFSCPSLIVYQSYPKGIQVHFYKNHFDHEFKPYCMEETYRSYSIADLLQIEPTLVKVKKEDEENENYNDGDANYDNDLYIRFKTLMENIIIDAARVNIDSLKVLSGKALEMHSYINEYDEDMDINTDNSSMRSFNSHYSEHNVSETKRKHDTNTSITSPLRKKLRSTLQNTPTPAQKSPILQHIRKKPVNSYSLADDKDSDKILKELDKKPENASQNSTETSEITKEDIKSEKASQNSTETSASTRSKSPKIFKKIPQFDRSPSAFNDTYKDFVSSKLSKETKKQKLGPRNDVPEKKLKTKMGLFNPNSPKRNLSPQANNIPPIAPKINTAKGGPMSKRKKTVRDFKYEVKERDNDCNILILKI